MARQTHEQPQAAASEQEDPHAVFRSLQARLKELAVLLTPHRDEQRGMYHECIGASFEQPQFSAAMTANENRALADLVQRIEQFLEECKKSETLH